MPSLAVFLIVREGKSPTQSNLTPSSTSSVTLVVHLTSLRRMREACVSVPASTVQRGWQEGRAQPRAEASPTYSFPVLARALSLLARRLGWDLAASRRPPPLPCVRSVASKENELGHKHQAIAAWLPT